MKFFNYLKKKKKDDIRLDFSVQKGNGASVLSTDVRIKLNNITGNPEFDFYLIANLSSKLGDASWRVFDIEMMRNNTSKIRENKTNIIEKFTLSDCRDEMRIFHKSVKDKGDSISMEDIYFLEAPTTSLSPSHTKVSYTVDKVPTLDFEKQVMKYIIKEKLGIKMTDELDRILSREDMLVLFFKEIENPDFQSTLKLNTPEDYEDLLSLNFGI